MNATAILVDDEANLLDYLTQLLKVSWPELRIVGTAQNGREALTMIRDLAPDVVFLDIRMPGLSGMQVAQQLNPQIQIVFVTAYDEYAVAAFDSAAADYLLKPVEPARLDQTVARVQERLQANATPTNLRELLAQLAQNEAIAEAGFLQWLRVGIRGKAGALNEVQLVACDEVVYLRSAHKYTSVFTATEEHLLRTSLSDLENRLDPEKFWRIHRGLIVAIDQVMAARRDLRGRYTLTLRSRPETIRSSSAYKSLFAQM